MMRPNWYKIGAPIGASDILNNNSSSLNSELFYSLTHGKNLAMMFVVSIALNLIELVAC